MTRNAVPPTSPPASLPQAFTHLGLQGHIDVIEGAPLPVVRVFGWFAGETLPPLRLHTTQGTQLFPLSQARSLRQDVVAAGAAQQDFCGFRVEFLLPAGHSPERLLLEDECLHTFPQPSGFADIIPHYLHLFEEHEVLGREAIYGYGPPTDVSPEFKNFAALAEGNILDFGCGSGDLLCHLRNLGHKALGIELDTPLVRGAMKAEARPYITLYDGRRPLPFSDYTFDWLVSTEVIEHIPDIQHYIGEFARLLRPGGKMLITTPDITSIPSSFPANCVPWHLLESTHYNFFTPRSLTALFAAHFELQAHYCLGATRINGLFIPGSIGAIFCRRTAV